MAVVNKELYALVVAVGKLKRRLGVKKTQSREWIVYWMSADTWKRCAFTAAHRTYYTQITWIALTTWVLCLPGVA